MNTFKKVLLGISAFFTGLFTLAFADIILEEGLSFILLGLLAFFTFLTVFQIKKVFTTSKQEIALRDAKYEAAYQRGRDMVNRVYNERINGLTDQELKAELHESLHRPSDNTQNQEEIDPYELQEMLSNKEKQANTQKAE